MFGLSTQVESRFNRVKKAADDASFRNFGHAAASIAKDARSSIQKSPVASEPGTPPNTRRGRLAGAIRYAADMEGAVIGPRFSVAGASGTAHEFGATYKGRDFLERPFMGPALERALPRFLDGWRGSITE